MARAGSPYRDDTTTEAANSTTTATTRSTNNVAKNTNCLLAKKGVKAAAWSLTKVRAGRHTFPRNSNSKTSDEAESGKIQDRVTNEVLAEREVEWSK